MQLLLLVSIYIGFSLDFHLCSEPLTISHGDLAPLGKYPYHVAIFAEGKYYCGGTIIDEKNVLTAAHCLLDRKNKPFALNNITIKAGHNNLESHKIREFAVAKTRSNNYFSSKTNDYDIALVKVNPPFNFFKLIAPIDIETNTNVENGVQCDVAGWGVLQQNSTETTTLLRHAVVTVMDTKVCKNAYAPLNKVQRKRMLCAGSSNYVDACSGDSGGGLVCNGKLTGIVSWGIGCGIPQYPTVYTKVAYFKHFINKHR